MSSKDDEAALEKKIKKGSLTAYDIQRTRLERLMKDPSKPAFIPEPRKEKDPNKAPEWVYNVMGSSAGAGSGEFHIYRHIRRKEYQRQKVLGEQAEKIELNEAYHLKLAENERQAEERTAKKRAKRMKKKAKQKMKKSKKNTHAKDGTSSESSDEEEASDKEEAEKEKSKEEENKESKE